MAKSKGRGRSIGRSKPVTVKVPEKPRVDPSSAEKKDKVPGPAKGEGRELVVEIDSPVENFLTLMVLFHGTFSVLVSSGMYMAFTHFLPEKAMKGFYLICGTHGFALLLLTIIRFSFSCRYLISEEKRMIDKVTAFGPLQLRDAFLKFEDIEVITVTGIRKQTTKHPIDKWYVYTVCLLEKSGVAHEFSREKKDLATQQQLVAQISAITGCQKMTCEKEHVVKIQKSEGRVIVDLVHLPIRDFSGDVLPFEAQRQRASVPVIVGAFFISFFLVFAGTAFLFMLMGHL